MTSTFRDARPSGARLSSVVALTIVSALALFISLLGAGKASAAPGDPFDALTPYVFVGQESPTGLYRAVAGAGGTVTFSPEGSTSGITYNAIGYNTNTNYIYGVANTGDATIPQFSVIRIGQGGVITQVGTTPLPGAALWGAFDETNSLYVGLPGETTFRVIDSLTGNVTSTGTLATAVDVVDLTYANGYFWGITTGTGDLVRIDLKNPAATKPVDIFPVGMPSGGHGAAWTFGNGNLGFSHNVTGTVTQLAIANPGSANPTITVVSTSPGPASGNNDGAASPGAPTDLSITKDAPTSYDAGDSFTYDVTVTNAGPGLSTGSVVNDLVPAGLSNVRTTTPGCTVVNNQVTCTVGQLAAGESQTITITVDSPASATQCFTNAASVLANEVDPDTSDNNASVTSCPRALSVTKTSSATDATRTGDTVTYSVTARNTGLGSYTAAEPAVLFDDLSAVLDDATYNNDASATSLGLVGYTAPKLSWSGPLGPNQSVTVTYTVTTRAGGDGVMRNVAFVPNDPDDPETPGCAPPNAAGLDPVTGEPCAQLTNGLPSLTVVKSANPTSVTAIGDTITYSYLVTNTGGTTLAPVTVDETAFSGTGPAPVPSCPAAAASLDPGDTVTCTASYTATEADINAGSIVNTAVANGTPPGGPAVTSPPSTVTVTTPGPPPPLEIEKTSDSTAATRAGDTVTYTVTATNTGLGSYTAAAPAVVVDDLAGILDDARYDGGATASRPGTIDFTEPKLSWTGPLGAGQSISLTYAVVVGSGGDGVMRNVAFQPGDPSDPRTPECAPPTAAGLDPTTGEPCAQTTTRLPALTVAKTADRATVSAVGETVTYSYRIVNTGGTTLAPVSVEETAFSGTGTAPVPTCPAAAGSLAPGESVTCTATYVTTEADLRSGTISNTAVATGTPPGGPPVTSPPSTVRIVTPPPPTPPAPPAPQYDLSMTKSATRKQITVGDTITYRLLVKNHGPDAADGVRVTDKLPSHLKLRDATTPQGACTVRGNDVDCTIGKLDNGQSVTVTVRATALRSGSSSNTARVIPPNRPDGLPPTDPPGNNTGTATVKIVKPQLKVRKTSNRSSARPGQTVTYAIRVTNPSRRAVRNVRTCDRLPSGLVRVSTRPTAKVSRGQHCWTARRLGAGRSVTYRITVRATSGASGRKTNVVQAKSPDARSGRATRSIRVTSTPARAGGVTG